MHKTRLKQQQQQQQENKTHNSLHVTQSEKTRQQTVYFYLSPAVTIAQNDNRLNLKWRVTHLSTLK